MKKILSLALSGILSLGLFCPTCYAGPHLKFTEAEDAQLKQLVEEFGESQWGLVAERMTTPRNARQYRDRYINYLRQNITNASWTNAEEQLLLSKRQELGPNWTAIARFFPNRTEINVKNRFFTLQRQQRKAQQLAQLAQLPAQQLAQLLAQLPAQQFVQLLTQLPAQLLTQLAQLPAQQLVQQLAQQLAQLPAQQFVQLLAQLPAQLLAQLLAQQPPAQQPPGPLGGNFGDGFGGDFNFGGDFGGDFGGFGL
ncbi:MAG: hypothetical protein LBR79_03160 [Oscillospiraceae bacterium]|jgi:hypothetical protein|nr:hypothetical protein [Oscillospiraceae bacterium]